MISTSSSSASVIGWVGWEARFEWNWEGCGSYGEKKEEGVEVFVDVQEVEGVRVGGRSISMPSVDGEVEVSLW
jgi:hypothetical protein